MDKDKQDSDDNCSLNQLHSDGIIKIQKRKISELEHQNNELNNENTRLKAKIDNDDNNEIILIKS